MDNLSELFGEASDAFALLAQDRFQYVNQAFGDLLGVDPAALQDRSFELAIASRDHASFFSWLTEGAVGVIEVGFIHRDGAARRLELRPMRGIKVEGAPRTGVMVFDVSRRQKMQIDLLLADRMMSIGALAGGVAHEVNNPLSYVLGNLEFLENELPENLPFSCEARTDLLEALAECREGAQRVRDIVANFRAFARADASVTRDLDLNRVVELAVNMAFVEIRHRARFVKVLEPVPAIRGNEARVCQLILNLLLNAAHSMTPGEPTNSITIKTWSQAEHVCLSVEDNGPGIPDALLSRLFDPFFTTKPIGLGTGLGLAISKAVVAELGGDINVESQLGRGSRFIVRILKKRPEPGRAKPLRILIVDDDPLIGQTLRQLLGSCGHAVEVETSGVSARARLVNDRGFDAILLDLMMPEVSGDALFHWLMEKDRNLARRVGFMSAAVFKPSTRAFVEAGDHPLLEKPFAPERVLHLVERLAQV